MLTFFGVAGSLFTRTLAMVDVLADPAASGALRGALGGAAGGSRVEGNAAGVSWVLHGFTFALQ